MSLDFISPIRINKPGVNVNTESCTTDENMNPNSNATPEITEIECDYDEGPTELYSYLQKKDWEKTSRRIITHPSEVRIFISRKEPDGSPRWRLLPIHAAIIFKAPEEVIEALLASYPEAAQQKDDQGMLPLHLAFRSLTVTEMVVSLLLMAYPEGMNAIDNKGRTPRVVLQNCENPNKDQFLTALERIPRLHAVTTLKRTYSTPTNGGGGTMQMQRIESLEEELNKTQEASQVLVDHINALEAQLNSRGDTERFLATKIANLDTKVKESNTAKEIMEAKLTSELEELKSKNLSLVQKNTELEEENKSLKAKLDESESKYHELYNTKFSLNIKIQEKLQALEAEYSQSLASNAILEAQLKKKVDMEQILATQVKCLAEKLADNAECQSSTTSNLSNRIDKLRAEKTALKQSLSTVSTKLLSIFTSLESLANEQDRIVEKATKHEQVMMENIEKQKAIIADASRQEQIMTDAAKERETIVEILTRQADDLEKVSGARDRIFQAIAEHDSMLQNSVQEKTTLFESINTQKDVMKSMRSNIAALQETIEQVERDDDISVTYSYRSVPKIIVDDHQEIAHKVSAVSGSHDQAIILEEEEENVVVKEEAKNEDDEVSKLMERVNDIMCIKNSTSDVELNLVPTEENSLQGADKEDYDGGLEEAEIDALLEAARQAAAAAEAS